MENKVCRQCNSKFVVTDEDRLFLNKISPEFDGNKYILPSPTLCPECRMRHLFSFRSEWKLYNRKCDLTGKDMVSFFSPNSPFRVCHSSEWVGGKWDGLDFGREFDFSRGFFEQFKELLFVVPQIHLSNYNNENSDYAHNALQTKDCYLIQDVAWCERSYYGNLYIKTKEVMDCYWAHSCERCYEVFYGIDCYNCYWSDNIKNCRDVYWSRDCVGCKDCFGCANLNNKQYYVFNQPVGRAEFEKKRDEYLFATRNDKADMEEHIVKMWGESPRRYAQNFSGENCSGDYISNAQKVKSSYFIDECQEVSYSNRVLMAKMYSDAIVSGVGEVAYMSSDVGEGNNIMFSKDCFTNASNIFYSVMCYSSHDVFGCVGLRQKEYCIFNEQYSKEEYEKLVGKIIEHMQATGEWGEYFPPELALVAYNESSANDYYPLSKEEALKFGYRWQEESFDIQYDGPWYEPIEDIRKYNPKLNSEAEGEINKCLQGILKCEVSGRPYRMVAPELYFYIEHNLSIPRLHPDERRKKRLQKLNPFWLYKRRCMCEGQGSGNKDQGSSNICTHEGRCLVEFETTYAPADAEKLRAGEAGVKVYCEECYQKAVVG